MNRLEKYKDLNVNAKANRIKELEKPQFLWRESIIKSLKQFQKDTIIFSHFMVINCAVGWINNSEKFVSFHPDNCSVTKIKRNKNDFEILSLGKDFATTVQ